jgi:hypothetical protein
MILALVLFGFIQVVLFTLLAGAIMDFTAALAALTQAESDLATAVDAAVTKLGSVPSIVPPDAVQQVQALADKVAADAAKLAAAAA